MAETRTVLFKGSPVELVGPALKPGDTAPDFTCVGEGLSVLGLADTGPKARLFNVVPSLDTPVCNTQTRKFSTELQALGERAAAYTVSLDLPFAQQRWCTDAKVQNLKNLSDARDHSFGSHYGVLIKGLPIPLLARAVFVVDPRNTVKYVEYVSEITQEPNYEPAIKALKEAAGADRKQIPDRAARSIVAAPRLQAIADEAIIRATARSSLRSNLAALNQRRAVVVAGPPQHPSRD